MRRLMPPGGGPSCAYPFYRATRGAESSLLPSGARFFSNAVPSVEAIPMVNMVVNSPDVAHGLASGAAINVELNSGTNQFHGEVSAAAADGARCWEFSRCYLGSLAG